MEMLRSRSKSAQLTWLTLAKRVRSCLRNVVALFHVIEKELEWRRARGQLEGFGAMLSSKPLVAVGADHPLEDEILMADYFRMVPSVTSKLIILTIVEDGVDGLAGVHTTVRFSIVRCHLDY
jgi:hypothetical protein